MDATPGATDGVAAQARFGSYRIVREVGRGGMGAVYLAERSDDQYTKRVALKVLPAWSAGDQRRVQRFLEERQILAALDHPDIARLVDGGVTPEGLPWFALEYVDGVPLDRYCDDGRLTVDARLALFCRICDAVQYAHRNLVVHCDLKPANILVTPEGHVRLLDFGIATLLGGPTATTLSAAGERILTPLYASPEQVRGEPISIASDVHALGVLLSVLLTGRSPYRTEDTSPNDAARVVLDQAPRRPSEVLGLADGHARDDRPADTPARRAAARRSTPDQLRRSLAGDLDAIVLKAVEQEPSRRYATAQQLESDVQRYLEHFPVLARPGSRLGVARKFVRRHRLGVGAAAALAVLATSFGVAMTMQSARIREQAIRVALERDRAELVSHFLRAMFTSTEPATQARGITARELLDSAAARIDDARFTEPAERARLMYEMAGSYHRLGYPARARDLLDRSLAIRRALRPRPAREIGETLHLLGTVQLEQHAVTPAGAAYTEALALRRRTLGPRHQEVARTLVGLANVRRAERRLPEAEALAREAMAIDRNRPEGLARGTHALAWILLDGGRHREASRLFERALALARQTHPEEHVDVASAALGLAAAMQGTGDQAAADSLLRYALALHQRLLLGAAAPAGVTLSLPTIPADDRAAAAAPGPASDSMVPRAAAARAPAGPPDESRIVFVTDRDAPDPTGDFGAPGIYVMAADGSVQRRLTRDGAPASFPAWSPDGTMIAFGTMRGGVANVVVMRADGSGPRALVDTATLGVGAQRPTWSPDGRRIAFQSMLRPDLYVIGVDGRGLTRITEHPARDLFPSWSPDGRRIAFISDRDGNNEIYLVDPDGTNLVRLTANEANEQRPSWSPDGRRIAFASDRDGDPEIYVMNADGSAPVRLTSSPGVDGAPSWSPDGRRIVFHRRVFGHLQVHVMDADGSNTRRLTEPSGAAFNGFPNWQRRR